MEDDDIVCACLDGLGEEYVHFRTSMNTRDDLPEFTDLISMLILEKKNVGLMHLLLKERISLKTGFLL